MKKNLINVLIVHMLSVLKTSDGVQNCDELIAYTEAGRIRGICQMSEENNTFISFLGMPYAEQPVGEWRFKDLRPLKPWSNVYNATKEGPACPQNVTSFKDVLNTTYMSEACIYANIHVPLKAFPGRDVERVKGSGIPILVFLHGGLWVAGSGGTGFFGPEYMIDKNVIVITINYRLGAYGFLSLGSPSIPGNAGLRDTLMLLKWVKRNAKAFGGDPDNVTLGGQSAGAVNAHILSLSNAAKGLFKRAILLSGAGVRSFYSTSPQHAKDVAVKFLSIMNITSTDPEEIHRQLIRKPDHEISDASIEVDQIDYEGIITNFCPVVEQQFSQTRILDDDPENLLDKRGQNIPLMIGFANNEYQIVKQLIKSSDFTNATIRDPKLILSLDLAYKVDEATARELGKRVENRYYDGNPSVEKFIDSQTEIRFQYPGMFLARSKAKLGAAEVYLYKFSYEPDFSVVRRFKNVTYKGAAHFEDQTFIFKSNSMNDVKGFSTRTCRDRRMIKQMTGYIKNFMVCSKPICDKKLKYRWPPVCPNKTIVYEDIRIPGEYKPRKLTGSLNSTLQFSDDLYQRRLHKRK